MPKNVFLTIMIAKNTFSQGQGGSKSGQNQKRNSISNSATEKLSREGCNKKNPWCDPLRNNFGIGT